MLDEHRLRCTTKGAWLSLYGPCPVCGASRGNWCITTGGNHREPHAQRAMLMEARPNPPLLERMAWAVGT